MILDKKRGIFYLKVFVNAMTFFEMKQKLPEIKALLLSLIFWSFPMVEAASYQYNYNLSTGTVGTDDDDLASVFYNINRMEMKSEYETENSDRAIEALGETLFYVSDILVHFDAFAEKRTNETDAQKVRKIRSTFKSIALSLREAAMEGSTVRDMCKTLHDVSKQSLSVVDDIVALDR